MFAAPFDASRLGVGAEAPVIEGVWRGLSRVGHFAISPSGVLAYIPGPASLTSLAVGLVLTDRSGTTTALPLRPGSYDCSVLGLLTRMKRLGYDLHVFYIWLPSADLAVARVR